MSSNFRSASKGLCRDNFSGPGQFGNLHGIFVGSDGSVYVASIVALAFVSIVSIVSIAWLLGQFAQVSQLSSEAESWLRVHSILADITTSIVSPEDSAGNWKPSIGTVLARSEDLGGAYTHAEAFETREGRASVTRISALSEIEADINGFRTSVVAALATDLSAEQQEYGRTIQSSAEALLKVIDDVLDFSKVEAGKLELESVDFDLRPIVSSVLALISPVAWNKGVCVFSLLRCDVPVALRGDPGRLRQILTNLLGNALKFTAEGEIALHVELDSSDKRGSRIRFSISDTGIGIAPDRVERLFDSFSQADVSTTRQFGGTGLGLAIAMQMTQLMGSTTSTWS